MSMYNGSMGILTGHCWKKIPISGNLWNSYLGVLNGQCEVLRWKALSNPRHLNIKSLLLEGLFKRLKSIAFYDLKENIYLRDFERFGENL